MGLGTRKDLIKAANGIFRPREVPPVEPAPADTSPYEEAMMRRSAFSTTPMQRLGTGMNTPAAQMPSTATYGKLFGGLTRPMSGLSSKGKYGGFYSAGDLETAISGSAMRFATEAPQLLRSQARERYNKLDPMYDIIRREYLMPGSYNKDLQRQYVRQLGEWYAKNAAPAEEYLATAQQIEATPVSSLASSIASQVYGMNPDLARGKFSGLDKRMFEEQRDLRYRQDYGMPYEQYRDVLDTQTDALKEQSKSQVAQIEAATGSTISQIRNYSRMNDQALYGELNMQDVQYQDNNGDIVSTSTPEAIGIALGYFNDDDQDSIIKFIQNIRNSEGQEDVARLIEAIIGIRTRSSSRNIGYLEDYFLNNPYGE